MDGARELVHGTAIAAGGRAALIRGASGSGKSDLALRCICVPRSAIVPMPAELLSDDQVVVSRRGDRLVLSSPETIRGKLEVRGVGVLSLPHAAAAELGLVVDLVSTGSYERLPEPYAIPILGVEIPALALAPFEASSPLKLLLALSRAGHDPYGP